MKKKRSDEDELGLVRETFSRVQRVARNAERGEAASLADTRWLIALIRGEQQKPMTTPDSVRRAAHILDEVGALPPSRQHARGLGLRTAADLLRGVCDRLGSALDVAPPTAPPPREK